jgi:ParB family transcriptional regulator, chromosome partitioning protein
MNDRRRPGLGKGLGALIPTAPGQGYGALATAGAVPAQISGAGTAGKVGLGEIYRADLDEYARPPEAESEQTAGRAGAGRSAAAPDMNVVPGAYFAEVPVGDIVPNARQPREIFDEEAMAELVHSIKEVGLLQPIVVRSLSAGEASRDGARYELIMGERRWRAAQLAGLELIPTIVRDTDDERMLLDALLENLHRSQLNPLEEAAAYDQLLKDFSCTHEVLADRIGRSRSQVTNTLRLLKLPPAVQLKVAAGTISAGHARTLLSLDDPEEQQALATRITAEGLSVRSVEEIVAVRVPVKAPRKVRPGGRVSPALTDLEGRLSDRFETRVRVNLGATRGRIVVEFASLEDLDRIVGAMAPGEGVK